MPQDSTQPQSPQLDPGFDYAKLPDGSYAKFKKGTSEAEMRGRLIAAGKLPATPVTPQQARPGQPSAFKIAAQEKRAQNTQKYGVGEIASGSSIASYGGHLPYYGFTPGNMLDAIVRQGMGGLVKFGGEVAKDAANNPNWFSTMPQGQRPSTMQKFVYDPAREQQEIGLEQIKSGKILEGSGHVLASGIPLIGPWAASLGEQSGRGDVGGAVGQAIGGLLAGKTGKYIIDIVKDPATGEMLKNQAAKMDSRTLRVGKERTKLPESIATGRELAARHLWGLRKTLPEQIDLVRNKVHQETMRDISDATTSGKTIDVYRDVVPIIQEAKQVLIRKGVDQTTNAQVEAFLKQLDTKTDPRTGQQIPRDWSKLTPSELYDLMSYEKGIYGVLSKYSKFEATRPEAVNNLARRIREKAIAGLDQAVPGVASKMASEHELINNRDAAVKLRTDAINGKSNAGRGMIYSTTGLALYGGLKMLGLGGMALPFIGTIAILKALASVAPRTLAANLLYRAGELWDTAVKASAGPTAPLQPSSPTGGPQLPQGGQPLVNKGVMGQNAPGGASARPTPPVAPASVVSTNPATGIDTVPTERPLTRGTMLPEKATRARAGSGDYVKGEPPKAAAPSRNVAESNTKNKAMLDRLDTLYERQAKPKSGADRNAIEREIAEIKRVLSGEAKGTDASAINKRIADRERLAAKRSEAKSATPGAQTAAQAGTTAEPAAQGMSPEQRSLLLDAGYKKLATYDGGPEMVKAMRKLAKDMSKVDPSYDEVTALTDALNALREVSGQ